MIKTYNKEPTSEEAAYKEFQAATAEVKKTDKAFQVAMQRLQKAVVELQAFAPEAE